MLGIYSLVLYGLKSKKFLNKNYFTFFSKEGSILFNNIVVIVVCATVFLGTLYPLLVEIFTNNKISVGEPYFNSTAVPIMLPAILVMGIGPILAWGKEDKIIFFKKISPIFLFSILVTFLFFLNYKSYSAIGIVGIFLSFWIILNNLLILIRKIKKNLLGMVVAHLGIGVLILGITGSSIWQIEKIIKMKIKNEIQIQEYSVVFNNITEIKGPNYVALQGIFTVYDDQKNVITKLTPENRFYPITKIFTTEASIHTNLFRDLYIVLGKGNLSDGWIVKIYHNPLVIWIWIGSLTIFLGGMISMKHNMKKIIK